MFIDQVIRRVCLGLFSLCCVFLICPILGLPQRNSQRLASTPASSAPLAPLSPQPMEQLQPFNETNPVVQSVFDVPQFCREGFQLVANRCRKKA